jgi:hypothetical protein
MMAKLSERFIDFGASLVLVVLFFWIRKDLELPQLPEERR